MNELLKVATIPVQGIAVQQQDVWNSTEWVRNQGTPPAIV